MGLYLGGLIFVSEIWGAYFRQGLFFGGAELIIGILRYFQSKRVPKVIKKIPAFLLS